MKKIKIGSDFSGVGAFNQALIRLGIDYEELFACDMDKYARQTFSLNFGEPKYFPKDVYEREIPKESLDIFMTSPPCQSFSLAGKRQGKDDEKGRGILFFNSLEFIQKNNPRFFIFENVKGLLSHDKTNKDADYGNTFKEWISLLGGKSVNGVYNFFPYEDAVPYHIYFQVLNAKHYGIPQNRERIFIVGIRDDEDNDFQFPRPFPLTKRLKDVLEPEVDEKYFLSDKLLSWISGHREKRDSKGKYPYTEDDATSGCITARYHKMGAEDVFIGTWRTHEDGKGFRETEDNNCPTIPARAREDGSGQPVVKILGYTRDEKGKVISRHEKDCAGTIHTASGGGGNTDQFVTISTKNSKGYDIAEEEEEDSINFSVPSSETRRGRVGKKVSQTLDTNCQQGIATRKLSKQEKESLENEQYKGVAVHPNSKKLEFDGFKDTECPTLLATDYKAPKCIEYSTQRIRRLTPTECFRLMDFNEDFIEKTISSGLISDSQLYKQAGNSICVGVLAAIISKLKL